MGKQLNKTKTNLVLDTDMGTDNDDAFALAYLLKSQRANVKAIATVLGNTKIRAKIARKLERVLQANVSIVIGQPGPKEAVRKYWTGIETLALTEEEIQEPMKPSQFPQYDKDSVLVCIGPLTNVAWQLKNNPSIKNVKKLYVMGSHEKSHNFEADKKSYQAVFQQPWDIYMIRKEDSKKIAFTREELEQFKGTKLGNFLYNSAIRWLDYSGKSASAMYDVLTVSAALGENCVRFKKKEDNRFVSYRVSSALKKRILKVIKEN